MPTQPIAHPIVLLVFPDFLLLDATGPLQVFASANSDTDRATQQAKPAPLYRLRTVSLDGGLVASSAGLSVDTEALPSPASLRGATLIISGGRGVHTARLDPRLLRWVTRTAAFTARSCSVCTGAFLLAQTGLLDGKQAVTHWAHVARFKALFPAVHMLDDAIHVQDGTLYTSAGVTAGMDLCLSLLQTDHGPALAQRVAKQLVLPLRRSGGQRQFSAALLAHGDSPHGLVTPLLAWLQARLNQAITVNDMAHAVAVSPRTLHRALLEQTGHTPARFLSRLRLEKACALLESSTLPLKRVAQQSGLVSEYNLRRALHLALGVTPGDYRARFSGQGKGSL